MITLESVYRHPLKAEQILYDLLSERTEEQSISHKGMPTTEEHAKFVRSHPYHCWYIIHDEETGEPVGATYISRAREIGIFIFAKHAKKGYGTRAVSEMMTRWPGRLYANINPDNDPSRKFFERLGAKLIQVTYQL